MNSSHEIETQRILQKKKKPTKKEEQPKSDRWQRGERETVELEPPRHSVEFRATTLCI